MILFFQPQRERNSEEFKKISPRGLVPVLITPSGHSIFEGPAIINFLLETHDTNLIAPIGNPDSGYVLSLSFLSTALLNANNRFSFLIDTAQQKLVLKKKLFQIGKIVTIFWKNTLTLFIRRNLWYCRLLLLCFDELG